MSASPTARQAVQTIRQICKTDPMQMPEVLSSTPGGTLYSTTPNGTKLIYERGFMKNLRNSPLSRTPPSNIPSCLLRGAAPRTPFRKCVPLPTEMVKQTESMRIIEETQFPLEL